MSDRIAVFNDGVIQQLAPPPDLYERPTNAFVAQFIGENNRIFGKVAAVDGSTASVELAGGLKVAAHAVKCGAAGGKTMLSIRPERVIIGDESAPNRMEGKVVELIYLGDHIRCRMEVAGTDDFIVKVANSHAHAALKVGERTTVGWATEDCRALDAV